MRNIGNIISEWSWMQDRYEYEYDEYAIPPFPNPDD